MHTFQVVCTIIVIAEVIAVGAWLYINRASLGEKVRGIFI
jgi:hypothetical protein